MGVNIRKMQYAHKEWADRNFPGWKPHEPLLGLVEELGELAKGIIAISDLAHAHLKDEQGIRHTPDEILAMKLDAVGDIYIFLMSYCNGQGFDLENIVEEVWTRVQRRNWQADPQGAGS